MDRNTLLFIVLTGAVLIGWDALVLKPQRQAYLEQQKVEQAASLPEVADIAPASASLSIDKALENAPGRVAIDTPSLVGSINLSGARIDDLQLKNYREELDGNSPMIRLLSPLDTEHGHYVEQRFVLNVDGKSWNSDQIVWSAPDGSVLTPQTPVTLTAELGPLAFRQTIAVDDMFVFTIKQEISNNSGKEVRVEPIGIVVQRGIPTGAGRYQILHEGPLAVTGRNLLERKYKNAIKKTDVAEGMEGWVGITNKYWLAAAAPPQGQHFSVTLKNAGTQSSPIFQAIYALDEKIVPAGASVELTSHIFGGAKDVDILRSYEEPPSKGGLGIKDLDRAVDWGNLFFLTRPIFWLLDFFGDHVGNFGIAILLLTLCVKALMFPLANKAFESMSAMKKVQPKLEELKTKFGEDKAKLQQEMMALYQREKINPLAGCLPIIVQMPIFYALYKTLFVTIELRHQPFALWIKDLSAPDPTNLLNLFGLLPYDPSTVPLLNLVPAIGILPILYGVAMWFQTKLNPPAADPTQQQIMTLMPFMFVFLFAGFASGLVLYWLWSSVLSILQQWYIMKRNGVSIDWGERFSILKGKKATVEKK